MRRRPREQANGHRPPECHDTSPVLRRGGSGCRRRRTSSCRSTTVHPALARSRQIAGLVVVTAIGVTLVLAIVAGGALFALLNFDAEPGTARPRLSGTALAYRLGDDGGRVAVPARGTRAHAAALGRAPGGSPPSEQTRARAARSAPTTTHAVRAIALGCARARRARAGRPRRRGAHAAHRCRSRPCGGARPSSRPALGAVGSGAGRCSRCSATTIRSSPRPPRSRSASTRAPARARDRALAEVGDARTTTRSCAKPRSPRSVRSVTRGALPVVLAACDDKPAVRRRAVLALAAFDGPRGGSAAAAARSTDRDWQVRQAAEDLLGVDATSRSRSAALIGARHEHALEAVEALEAAAGAEHDALERRVDEVHRQIGLGADAMTEPAQRAIRRRRGARR